MTRFLLDRVLPRRKCFQVSGQVRMPEGDRECPPGEYIRPPNGTHIGGSLRDKWRSRVVTADRSAALDTMFPAVPISFNGAPGQGRRADPAAPPGKATAEMYDYHDTAASVLAASLAKRAPDTPASDSPPHTPSSRAAGEIVNPLAR